ncbi:MAG: hypothetical protein WBG73_15490 [Coleofasciculaceae cyanobacterium]
MEKRKIDDEDFWLHHQVTNYRYSLYAVRQDKQSAEIKDNYQKLKGFKIKLIISSWGLQQINLSLLAILEQIFSV